MVFGVTGTSEAETMLNTTPSAAPLVSFQNEELVAWLDTPYMATGTCCCCHCTVGCTPTWLMPVTITSGFSPSILLKIGVKSVVSGDRRIWSSTLTPIAGRHFRYSSSSGVVQAASSLITTAVFAFICPTSRSLPASQTAAAIWVDARKPAETYFM